MKIPKSVDIIGRIVFLDFKLKTRRYASNLSFWDKPTLIGVNSTHTTLFIFPETPAGKTERIHGRAHTPYEIPDGDLKAAGEAKRLIYVPMVPGFGTSELLHHFDKATIHINRQRNPNVFAIKRRGKIYGPRGIL